jgi:tetratricopeptide (TPR) repeat protein
MSLLLDALKKAELAKQVARADSATPEQAEAEPAAEESVPRAITTRAKLPDITQPLEILSDDLPSSEQKAPAAPKELAELSPQESEAYMPAAQPASARRPEHAAERIQAEQLFQVKEMDYNPRRPFHLTLAALGVVAVGYGGYVWWQMQPHYAVPAAAIPAPPAPPAAHVAAAPVLPQAPSPPSAPSQPAAAPAQASTGVALIPPIQPVRPRPRPQAASVPAAGPAPAASSPAQPSSPPVAVNAPVLSVDPQVEQGYKAFQRNDLAAARESYQKALAREPSNRDALLGMAAIDVRNGHFESAEARYLRLLETDPRDSQAVASILSLRGGLDPVASESRLKTLIAGQPQAPQLHFSLGNQYAQQSRWSEAQAAYFKAYSIDPENADYAFNLAVSLDQLHQRKPAQEYYQRALALVDKRPASFNPAQARTRLQELSK